MPRSEVVRNSEGFPLKPNMDKWHRDFRRDIDPEQTPITRHPGGAADLRAQLERLAAGLPTEGEDPENASEIFAANVEANNRARVADVPPETRQDLSVIMEHLEKELNKPANMQDKQYIRDASAVIEANQIAAGLPPDTATNMAARSNAFGAPEGEPTDTVGKLFEDSASFALQNKLEDMGDFFKRGFMEQPEQDALANRRRVERAGKQLDLDAKARAAGMDPEAFRGAPQFAGGMVPDVILGALPGLGTAKGGLAIASRVAGEVGVNSLLAGANVPLDQDPTDDMALMGGMALGMGMLGEIPGLAGNLLKSELIAASRSTKAMRAEQIFADAGISGSLAELSGSGAAARAELGVQGRPGGPRDQFMEQRKIEMQDSFDETTRQLNPNSLSTEAIIHQTKVAYDNTIEGMQAVASSSFRNTLRQPFDVIGAGFDAGEDIVGGPRFIDTPRLVAELQRQADLLSGARVVRATPSELQSIDDEILALSAGPQDLGTVARLLTDLTKKTKPSGLTIETGTKGSDVLNLPSVQRALNDDLDAIALEQNPLGEAVVALQKARREYGEDIAEVNQFKGRGVDRLLGKEGIPSAEDYGKRLIDMDRKSFQELMEMSEAASPGLANANRAAMFQELVDRFTKLDLSVVDEGRKVASDDLFMAINKMGNEKMGLFLGAEVDPVTVRRIQSTMHVLEAIKNGPGASTPASRGFRERIEQVAINAYSQNGAFIARLLAGELSPGALERMLFTPEGRSSLGLLGTPNMGKAEFAATVTHLANLQGDDDKQRAEEDKQRNQRRNMETVGNVQ